jgi:phage terminase large subunit GpA-like protein
VLNQGVAVAEVDGPAAGLAIVRQVAAPPALQGYYLLPADAERDFLETKKLPETLRVWTNTSLEKTWEESGEGLDETDLAARKEDYGNCPAGVVLITAGVGVQDNRLELEIVGWGRNEGSWSLDYSTIWGDPSSPTVWNDLAAALGTTYRHARGIRLSIRGTCIVSGHHTQSVYSYCRLRENKRVFAIKGIGGEGRPLVGRPSKNNIGKVRLFPVGVDTAKELIYSRLKIAGHGPGYCHFPSRYDDEYFKQLTIAARVIETMTNEMKPMLAPSRETILLV